MTHLFQPHQADEMLNPTNEGGITLLRHALTNESGSGSLSQEQGVQCAAEGSLSRCTSVWCLYLVYASKAEAHAHSRFCNTACRVRPLRSDSLLQQ